ncbi:MAG: TonB-dependent receptor [Bacteroidales bacterium]|nr:TonB-dependent receptor [Bacteroidales bacterium]
MKKLLLFVVSLFLMGAADVALGQRTVTGKVTSAEDPNGVPMVAVMVEGTTIGTSTDINGVYTLANVPATAKNLKFSAMGMKEKIVPITGGVVNVVLESQAIALEAVQISGYGVRKKVDNVGSAVAVGEDVIKRQTESNVINSLQGSVPGMQVSSASGQPGSSTTVRIRGKSSLSSGNDPLYVIDGVPIITGAMGFSDYTNDQGTDPLASLNPEDIESIQLLKDASATSIYGSRASNGVIVITTKKGQEGKTSFNVNAKIGIATPPFVKKRFQKVNLEDFKTFLYEARLNSAINRDERLAMLANEETSIWGWYARSNYNIDFRAGSNPTYTNWWDEVTRNGIIQDYSITASGGTKTVNYYASVGYFQNKGIVIGSDYTRYNARLNVDVNPTKWLSFGTSLAGSYGEINTVPTALAYAAPIWGASMMRPTDPVKTVDENGDLVWNTTTNPFASGYNPVALREDKYHDKAFQQQYKATFAPYLRVKLYKNLYVQSKVGIDFAMLKEQNVWSQVVNPQGASLGGLMQMSDESVAYMNITNTINWMPSIKKNNFNILVGQEAQRFNNYESYISGMDYATPDLMEITNATETEGSTYRADATLASYFANVEYDYDNRYYISASVRRDGSSRFGEDKRWGTFYSVGAKYRISAEKFMAATQNWVNDLSVRISYGTSGNQNVGYYQARGVYATTRYGGISGFAPSQLENTELCWESRNKFDVGLEFTIFNALTVEFDYYNDMTKDMIFARPLSYATGFGSIASNIGKMRNQGIELQVNAMLFNRKNFKWSFGFNVTTNYNEIIYLPDHNDIRNGTIGLLREGYSSAQLYTPEWAGVDPATGRPRWYGADGQYVFNYNEAVSRFVGTSDPKFYGGIQTRFDFYNFDIGLQFNYSYGNYIFSNDLTYLENEGSQVAHTTTYYVMENRWQRPGDKADIPQLINNGNNGSQNLSTRYRTDGSYFRIKSIMVGYTLPKKHAEKIFVSSLRIYASIDNLFTACSKNFRGYDPESGLSAIQTSNYPVPVNYTLGLSVGF